MIKKSNSNTKKRRVLCGICPAGCWVVVTYDGKGRIDKVRPDESSSFGVICKLGEHSAEIVYSRDRLVHPMRRKGAKGTYEFERISWNEAYDIIVDKLNRIKAEYGPEATSVYTGRGSFELAMCDIYQPKGVAVSSASSVLFPFGSPNTMGVGALCYVSFAMIAPHVTMGGMLINMFSDINNAQLIVVWGANPATDCPPIDLKRIVEAHNRGAQVVVIDPRRTMTAKLTNAEWIPIRPGTDGALSLGMCNVLIKEELYDETFVKNWTRGFDDFVQYVQHFRPEVVEGITGVPAETIMSLARRIAEANGALPVMYSGLEYSDSGVQAIRATHVLWALAGQLDVPGGGGPVGPEAWQKCNINELTDLKRYDPISGFPVYKALLCNVAKVSEGEEKSMDSGEYGISDSLLKTEDPAKYVARIYLDHNATTPLDPEVHGAMLHIMEDFHGNPSSIYSEGKDVRFAVEAARRSVAQLLNCTTRSIVFTGCGSEANNLAIKGIAFANWNNKNHIITTTVEHPSVLQTCKWLEGHGFKITYMEVDMAGRFILEDLASAITERTCLISVMTANNETGSIQPIAELANIARQRGVLFHTDGTQAIGKIPVDVQTLGVDLLTMSGHKLYGPKGVGALYIRKGVILDPLVHGGKQESGLRAGTENVIGIVGLGKAAELAVQRLPEMDRVRMMRDRLERGIKELLPEAKLNGHERERLPNTINMSLPGMRGESLVLALDQKGVSSHQVLPAVPDHLDHHMPCWQWVCQRKRHIVQYEYPWGLGIQLKRLTVRFLFLEK